MRRFFVQLLVSLAALTLLSAPAFAAFDLRGSKKIDLGVKSLDTAVSADGKWTFVLTEGGNVRVLTFRGEQIQVIKTGENYNKIEFSAAGNRLILSGGDVNDILILALDKIHALDTTGSSSKGPDEAPVVVAYFSDYQ
jgi:hypothetical protein